MSLTAFIWAYKVGALIGVALFSAIVTVCVLLVLWTAMGCLVARVITRGN